MSGGKLKTKSLIFASRALNTDLLQVRSPVVNFHVLRDASGLYLLDAGFIGGRFLLQRALRRRGWEREPIRGIIVTHGHLDHILNIAVIARETGAWIAAPRLDAPHYAGHPCYHQWAKVAGCLEGVGKAFLPFEPFVPNRWIDDGDFIDVWHGLRAVHLPGHTHGHTGYYCEHLRLMFSADIFASYPRMSHFAPTIFNSVPEQLAQSVARVLSLDLLGVIPNHGDQASPEEHLQRLCHLQHEG